MDSKVKVMQLLQKYKSKWVGSGENGSDDIKGLKWFQFSSALGGLSRALCLGSWTSQCTANFEEHWTAVAMVDSPAATPKSEQKDPFDEFEYVR